MWALGEVGGWHRRACHVPRRLCPRASRWLLSETDRDEALGAAPRAGPVFMGKFGLRSLHEEGREGGLVLM